MRTVLLAAVLSVLLSGMAVARHKAGWVADEAHSNLAECATADDRGACDAAQQAFLQIYAAAVAGSQAAQLQVAAMLAIGSAGVRQNPVQGCAWRLVAALVDLAHVVPAEVDAANEFCAPLGPTGIKVARARSREVIKYLHDNGVPELHDAPPSGPPKGPQPSS